MIIMFNLDEETKKFLGLFEPKTFADGTCHMIGSFANVGIIETRDGLVVFDISTRQFGRRVFKLIRDITDKPIKYLIYSHGHFDHCFGYAPFINEIKQKGFEMPQIIAHEKLLDRFKKYKMLDDYHNWINSMQFASVAGKQERATDSSETLDPTIIIRGDKDYSFKLGDYEFELYHDKGETDDSIWMYFPEKQVIFAGDLMISSFPNIGNPYKVQRYPKQWAIAMEKMLKKDAKYLVPGHGPLIEGKNKVKDVLTITAEAMNFIHDNVIEKLNEGKWFEQIYHEMLEIYPKKFQDHDYLKPVYGCYEFGIHAVYRLYHGWYNTGNPTDLFPSKSSDIASEFLKINDPYHYYQHSKNLFEKGNTQLALHIIDVLIKASTEIELNLLLDAYNLKYKLLKKRAKEQTSFIAFNIINNGAKEIKEIIKSLKNKN